MPRRPTKSSFETEVEIAGEPVEVTVEYSYTPGHPGRLYGPPEDCEPPEGPEVEILGVYKTEDKAKTDLCEKLGDARVKALEEQCCYEAEDDYDDARERAAEDRFDAMHDGD